LPALRAGSQTEFNTRLSASASALFNAVVLSSEVRVAFVVNYVQAAFYGVCVREATEEMQGFLTAAQSKVMRFHNVFLHFSYADRDL
jgi:hypothetical protein